MKILAVDMGTGTQDILLFDSRRDVENSLKMVQPSPTMIAHRRISAATQGRKSIFLTGVTMGGGPSHWAAERHLSEGFKIYATPDAAKSFNDDLDVINELGIQVVSEDEGDALPDKVERIILKDFDFEMIEKSFAQFDVSLRDLGLIAAAVFDHGAAPPGYSDRQFRFDYIEKRIQAQPTLTTFAFKEPEIPTIMTRMEAVGRSASGIGLPLLLMDTAPAAVLGAIQDQQVTQVDEFLMTNVGNFHTIGFHISGGEIRGVFEHHTGMLDSSKLDYLLQKLADGSLAHEEVFNDHGHGALTTVPMGSQEREKSFGVAVTGPRWRMMRDSTLKPYFAVPHGDMMMAGCYGLVMASAEKFPEYRDGILEALGKGREKPPWELV